MGQMALVYRHCPNRRKWRTTARPNAAVYFIPTQDLQMLVEKSVAQNKNEIAKWLLGGE